MINADLIAAVTPFVGVWIETRISRGMSRAIRVTPFVGVWIETANHEHKKNGKPVTPFVGVWIETRLMLVVHGCPRSHPSWVCGLKQE